MPPCVGSIALEVLHRIPPDKVARRSPAMISDLRRRVVIVCEARVHANLTDVEARLYRSATFSPNDEVEPNALGRGGTANERQWLWFSPHSGPRERFAKPEESKDQNRRWTQI